MRKSQDFSEHRKLGESSFCCYTFNAINIKRKCEKGSVSVVVLQGTLHQSSFFVKKGRVCIE